MYFCYQNVEIIDYHQNIRANSCENKLKLYSLCVYCEGKILFKKSGGSLN